MITILLSFDYILVGLLYICNILRLKIKTVKNNKIQNTSSESSIELIYNNSYDNLIANKSRIIAIIIFLLPLLMSIYLIEQVFNEYEKDQIITYLIFFPLFSKFILKEKIYKHQFFSLIISFITSILILISTIILEINGIKIFLLIIKIISGIILSLIMVLIKLLIDNYYISPYKIFLIIGIGSSILIIIINIIYSLIIYKDLSFITNSFNFPSNFYFYIIMIIIIDFSLDASTCLAIFYFSPNLLMISYIIFYIIYFFYDYDSENSNKFFKYCEIIGYIIIFIFSLIYNEIIICNFWDLNKNTKKYIFKREKEEDINIIEINDNNNEIEDESIII